MRPSKNLARGIGIGAAIAAPIAMLAIACSTPDPTQFRPGFGAQQGTVAVDAGTEDATVDAPATSDAATSNDAPAPDVHVPPREAGDASAASDASDATDASDAGTTTTTAFSNAPAYTPTTGPSTLQAAHNFGGANPTNPAGHACLSCHVQGGDATPFAMGGTVWTDPGATTPAPQIQVALRDNAGNTIAVYTDANGNFFAYAAEAGTLTPPEHVGVRSANHTNLMTGAINAANCNDCHKIGGQPPIHIP
jgi:hypothetical protein